MPPSLSKTSAANTKLTTAVFAFLRAHCPDARATSATVAWGREAALHLDRRNLGPNWLTGLGSWQGSGALWVADVQPAGKVLTRLSCGTRCASTQPSSLSWERPCGSGPWTFRVLLGRHPVPQDIGVRGGEGVRDIYTHSS